MDRRARTTETVDATDAKRQFDGLLDKVDRQEVRILVEKSGVPVAAIVSADDLRRLDRLDEERAERFKVIDTLRAAFEDVPPEEIDREADRAVATIRAETTDPA